ncbi:hypothetical protein B0H63DRAFT_455702 [Podospora didyma]|uniref:Uncharacterized protein n=1 Tax=Podospora didyma TaxID=330526 RepID=A0AAE0N1T9_9PEZI|nr:hypothetical protein B0H63DRAFT_455702 [Podospora didyma]
MDFVSCFLVQDLPLFDVLGKAGKRKSEEAATFIHAHIVWVVQIVMSREWTSDVEKAGQEEPPNYRQTHESPATPTAVIRRGWFTSFRRRLGFDVEDDFSLRPLLATPAADQYGSFSESSAPVLWPDLVALMESSNDVFDLPPPVIDHSIHTFFCDPQYHSTEGQEKSAAAVHLALYWYQTAGYAEIPSTWRGHLADLDFAISDEISVTLDPLCPARKVYTRTISIEYQRSYSEWPEEFLVLRPRDFKSPAEARVEVSVSCISREWLSKEPPDHFSKLIYKDAAVV